MAVIRSAFLRAALDVHDKIQKGIPYPFFDPACVRYEALRLVRLEGRSIQNALERFKISEYAFRKGLNAFGRCGVAGLIGCQWEELTEGFSSEAERKVFVLKKARPTMPATKMVILMEGFDHDVVLDAMRRLYASYGWANGTRRFEDVDFAALNLKVVKLAQLRRMHIKRENFFHPDDKLQTLLEVFRNLDVRGVTKLYPGSKVSFSNHKKAFNSLGLLGLVDRAAPPFRNSKLGFEEEGRIIVSKIQAPQKSTSYYAKLLKSKKIEVEPTCLANIFKRWDVAGFSSKFKGDIGRLLQPEAGAEPEDKQAALDNLPYCPASQVDEGYAQFVKAMQGADIALANPGVFLFLPYLDRLKIFEKAASIMDVDPSKGYGWFSLLLLNLGRIFAGISSVSKACKINEPSIALAAGLVSMPSNDSLLNGLAEISEDNLFSLRRHLASAAREVGLIQGRRVAFDFKMRDFTGDDATLKNIGKGPSPKRKICFPGFRPHLAWDVDTGAPIAMEFRNAKARATTTIKRFVRELLLRTLGERTVEHVYLDSEYTAEHVWQFVTDAEAGLGSDLTMCVKQNKKVKKAIDRFLETKPEWLYYDEEHAYTEETFSLPIAGSAKSLQCLLKRKESNGRLRCFGSTTPSLGGLEIMTQYSSRWIIENGIKDLVNNYYLDDIPGIEPHRVNVHYFVVTVAQLLFKMLINDYSNGQNSDKTQKTLGALRPEFIAGVNAAASRNGKNLIITWLDQYSDRQREALEDLFGTLTDLQSNKGLPFLGGLRIRYELAPSPDERIRNKLSRQFLEI